MKLRLSFRLVGAGLASASKPRDKQTEANADFTNAGLPLRQSYLSQELTKLEDSLTHLLAAQRFCSLAVRAITCPTFQQQTEPCDWHLGLFVTEQWLEEQGQQTIQEIQQIRTKVQSR